MAILEYTQLGTYMRVAAIDEETGIEAVSILPLNLSKKEMEQAAMRKLKYVLDKKSADSDSGGGFTI